jgi:hypothetical protein
MNEIDYFILFLYFIAVMLQLIWITCLSKKLLMSFSYIIIEDNG